MSCGSRGYVVRYGDWVEILDRGGNFITSFKSRNDMCEPMLTRYLNFMCGLDIKTGEYKIKRR